MRSYRYYLFDLDGTLTDPGIGITNSFMYALDKYGIHVKDRSELYWVIGPPLLDSFMGYFKFPREKALQAVAHYREYYRDKGIFENRVYEGIVPMLQELKNRGAQICLATSKPEGFAVQILQHFDLFRYFDQIGAATMDGRISQKKDVIEHLLKRLAPADRQDVLMIGDRDLDILGAKASCLDSVGVLWGYGSRQELQEAGANYLAASPEEIIKI